MVAILVTRARAESLLGKQIESGWALGDTLAQQVNSEPGYRGWIHEKERWKSLSLEALRVIYGEESRSGRSSISPAASLLLSAVRHGKSMRNMPSAGTRPA
jgi:hypothetical protein